MTDQRLLSLLGVVLGALVLGSVAGLISARFATSEKGKRFASNLNARMRTWWIMVGVFAVSILIGGTTTLVLFALTSFLAFREFATLTPTRRGDHRPLFLAFFLVLPAQYYFVASGSYGMFSIFIPVYAFILIPAGMALAGETDDFLNRTARVQWGLLTCVYFISHVPALLTLSIPEYDGSMAILLFFFVLVVQLNDVFQYVSGTLFGRHKIASSVSPNKTVEGFLGGVVLTSIVAASLAWATPFHWAAAAGLAAGLAVMGFLGDLTMSAVKRGLGVKDFAASLPGHGGVLDRLDSLAFTAPLFFHVVRFFYASY